MTLLLTDDEVRDLTDARVLVDAIGKGYEVEAQGGVELPDRLNLTAAPGFFRLMPGVVAGCGIMGFKLFNQVSAGGVQYLIGLCDEQSGALLALMDGAFLTAARTGATTGVAAARLATRVPREIGLIGSGLEAETNLAGVCAVLDVERVKVFSPNAQRRQAFADRMSKTLEIDVVGVDDPRDAADAAVVVVATFTGYDTGSVALEGEWLRPGASVLSVGSTMPILREVDTAVFARADLVVCDAPAQARAESGDMIAADQAGLLDDKLISLAELVAGSPSPPRQSDSIALFKSVGTALQDLTAAKAIYDRAVAAGVGTSQNLLMTKKPAGA